MTREEKINLLKAVIQECEEYQWWRKATLSEIIEDLEQESCDDAISRQAILNYIRDNYRRWFLNDDAFTQCVNGIKDVLPVTPQHTDVEIQKAHELEKEDKVKVLDKIRAEIEQLPTKTRINWNGCCPDIDYPEIEYVDATKSELLSIVDKYSRK